MRSIAAALALALSCGERSWCGEAAAPRAIDWSFFTGVEGEEGGILKTFVMYTRGEKGGVEDRPKVLHMCAVYSEDGQLRSVEGAAILSNTGETIAGRATIYQLDPTQRKAFILQTTSSLGADEDWSRTPIPAFDLPFSVGKKWRFKMPTTDLVKRLAPQYKGRKFMWVARTVTGREVVETPVGEFDAFAVETRTDEGRLTQTDFYAKGIGLVQSKSWNTDGSLGGVSLLRELQRGTAEQIAATFESLTGSASGRPVASGGTSGADVTAVQPTTVEFKARVYGTVAAEDIFRLKSDIEGRVETVMVSTFTWLKAKAPLAMLSNKELAAIIDSRGSTSEDMMQARWQNYYKPTRISCQEPCFLLKSYVKTRQQIMPDALLFEAAKRLRLIGHVDPQYADYVQFPQKYEYWPVDKPDDKRQAGVANFYRTGVDGRGGATFSFEMTPDNYFDPGTRWEGLVNIKLKRKLVGVPTSALFEHEGSVYLPVKVSTGVTTGDFTEILGGAEEGRSVLVFEHSEAAPRRDAGLAVPKRKPVGRQAATPKEEAPLEAPAQADEAPAPEPEEAPAPPAARAIPEGRGAPQAGSARDARPPASTAPPPKSKPAKAQQEEAPEEEPAPKKESPPEPPPKKDKAGEDPYAD